LIGTKPDVRILGIWMLYPWPVFDESSAFKKVAFSALTGLSGG
jgi:hypothetical protein